MEKNYISSEQSYRNNTPIQNNDKYSNDNRNFKVNNNIGTNSNIEKSSNNTKRNDYSIFNNPYNNLNDNPPNFLLDKTVNNTYNNVNNNYNGDNKENNINHKKSHIENHKNKMPNIKIPEFKVIFNPFIIDLIYFTILDNQKIDFYGFFYGTEKETVNIKTNDHNSSNKTSTRYLLVEAVDFIFNKNSLNSKNLDDTITESIKLVKNKSKDKDKKDFFLLGMFSTRTESEPIPSVIDSSVFFNFSSNSKINCKSNLPFIFGCFTSSFQLHYELDKTDNIISHKLKSRLYIINPNTLQDLISISYDIVNLKETTYKYQPLVFGESFNIPNEKLLSDLKNSSIKVITDLKQVLNETLSNINPTITKSDNKKDKENNEIEELRKKLIERKNKNDELVNEIFQHISN